MSVWRVCVPSVLSGRGCDSFCASCSFHSRSLSRGDAAFLAAVQYRLRSMRAMSRIWDLDCVYPWMGLVRLLIHVYMIIGIHRTATHPTIKSEKVLGSRGMEGYLARSRVLVPTCSRMVTSNGPCRLARPRILLAESRPICHAYLGTAMTLTSRLRAVSHGLGTRLFHREMPDIPHNRINIMCLRTCSMLSHDLQL